MINMNHTMSKTKIIKTQLINVIMLHALNYFIKCVKHVAIINNSWQEPQALEIHIFCSGIIFKYWQRPHVINYQDLTLALFAKFCCDRI